MPRVIQICEVKCCSGIVESKLDYITVCPAHYWRASELASHRKWTVAKAIKYHVLWDFPASDSIPEWQKKHYRGFDEIGPEDIRKILTLLARGLDKYEVADMVEIKPSVVGGVERRKNKKNFSWLPYDDPDQYAHKPGYLPKPHEIEDKCKEIQAKPDFRTTRPILTQAEAEAKYLQFRLYKDERD